MLLVCPVCGLAHEVVDGELSITAPLIATETTRLLVTGEVHCLAVWRLVVEIDGAGDSTWDRVVREAAPQMPYVYIPAFSSARSVLHQLGYRLTETQPMIQMTGEKRRASRTGRLGPARSETGDLEIPALMPVDTDASGFGFFSPVVISRKDARILSHFVYLLLRSGDARELTVVDYRLEVVAEELVFIPAVWDERCVHDANWRLLLSEFDGLVA